MTVQILGIRFFNGDVDEAIAAMCHRGGFLGAPSGTSFARLREDETYRRAILSADMGIADIDFMASPSLLLQHDNFPRPFAFKHLNQLLVMLNSEPTEKGLWGLFRHS